MKKIFILFSFMLSLNSFAQKDSNIYDFFGGKIFNNKAVFYRLVFQINNDEISGYMYTDEQGSNETKSIIKGKFNSKTKSIIFTEDRKLFSKSNKKTESLCYLKGVISLDLTPKLSVLKGSFFEETDFGLKCQNGEINLRSPDAYAKFKLQLEEKKKEIVVKKENKPKELHIPTFESNKKTIIKDDEEIVIFWSSEKIVLSIWDDMKEDGDRITISFNDEKILDNFTLKNKKKEIELKVLNPENKLVFTANNTGYLADNTARVDLFDNKLKHQIITKLQVNKSVTVIIKKQ